MRESLTDQALQVLSHAQDEARSLNHTFVGTEHLLLGLLHDGMPATTLQTLGLDLTAVRLEIEKLVHRGTTTPPAGELPLTPRAQHALECAGDEASVVGQRQVGAEHLLLGVFREPDGVAGQVLRNLGLDLERLRLQALRLRILQMTIVERVVRPIHASTARKRRIREELLAHLETIYEQELARISDSATALRAAAQRLGEPANLASEFAKALPAQERLAYHFERFLGWRAPESVARFMFRLVAQFFLIMAPLYGLAILLYISRFGWDDGAWVQLRSTAALLLVASGSAFLLGLLHFKLRDTIWGAFGSRKSPARALAYALLMALVTLVSGLNGTSPTCN